MEYNEFLSALNIKDIDVAKFMHNLPDPVITKDSAIYPIFSDIQGIGLASEESYSAGDRVMTLLDCGTRQVGARYLNHSSNPNIKSQVVGLNLEAFATRAIEPGEEITICYQNNLTQSAQL